MGFVERDYMKVKDNNKKIDALTKFFVSNAARIEIAQYLKDGTAAGKDTVFLIKLSDWEILRQQKGEKVFNHIIEKFSFLLTKVFHKTDYFVRVGPACFWIYNFGYLNSLDVERILQILLSSLKETKIFMKYIKDSKLHIGVCHVENEKSFDELLKKVELSLGRAEKMNESVVIDYQGVSDENYEHYPQEIPEYKIDYENIDTTFITSVINFLYGCMDLNFGIEMVLSRICNYYQTDQIYIMEKDYDNKGYSITHDWICQDRYVDNDNFKKLPLIIGNSFQEVYDENNLFICCQLTDLFKYNTFLALREKIRGTKSLMQSALYNDGEYIGYICTVDCKKERIWSVQEMATFTMIVKIINTSVLQLRVRYINNLITNRDLLTNAWNMNKFSIVANERIIKNNRNKALVTLDIKNFKFINSEYGYNYGNSVLISIANLLHQYINQQECFARLDSDTFILLLFYTDIEYLEKRLTSLLYKVGRCSMVHEYKSELICMMGIYLIEDKENKTFLEMIDCANMARKSIKDLHRSSYKFFSNEVGSQNMKEHHLAQIMKQSLNREEFIIYYQPKINIQTHQCIGLEALVRWQRENEIIQPNDFIPLFEKNHFILKLDNYVLEKVCQQLRKWIDEGFDPLPISVNLSRIHLEKKDIVFEISQLCNRYNIEKNLIELEITETAFLENEVVAIQKAIELKKAGFVLSMDDFGTGFSSLNLLKELPVDILKLDRTFFLKEFKKREKIILINIIHMAKELNMDIVSEGIETAKQVEFLNEIGCDIAQGFYYSRPYPMEELQKKLWQNFVGGEDDE